MKRLLYILVVLGAVSCVYDYEIPAVEGVDNALVLDGRIVVGGKATLTASLAAPLNQRVWLRPMELTSWWVEDDSGNRYEADHTRTIDLKSAPADAAYRMVVKYGGKTYSSSFQRPAQPPVLEDLTFTSDGTQVSCNLSLALSEESAHYVALSFEEIWKFHTEYVKMYSLDTTKWIVAELDKPDDSRYWCWTRRLSASEQYLDLSALNDRAENYVVNSFSVIDNRNHEDYNIKVSARTMTAAEYRFATTLNQQDGGLNLFTPNPGEIAGNVACEEDPSEKVYGYVSTSMRSTIVKHLDNRFLVSETPVVSSVVPAPEDYPRYYDLGFWPVRLGFTETMNSVIIWGPRRCIDCVEAGGTLSKPDFS